MGAMTALILFLAIVYVIRAINKVTTGDEKGGFVGETVLAGGCGIILVLGVIALLVSSLGVLALLLLACRLVLAVFASIRKYWFH